MGNQLTQESGQSQADFSVAYCAIKMEPLTDPIFCQEQGVIAAKNRICIGHNCCSDWKVCPTCLKQGEVEKMGLISAILCVPRKNLCKFHNLYGADAHRSISERERGIAESVPKVQMEAASAAAASDVVASEPTPEKTVVFPLSERVAVQLPERGCILAADLPGTEILEKTSENQVVAEVFLVKLSEIRPYKKQPRKKFNQAKLEKLASSIHRFGQRKPIELRPLVSDEVYKWELIDGERRYKACALAGLEYVRAIPEQVDDEKQQFLRSVLANFNYEGHTPLEIAETAKRLKDELGMTFGEIGADVFGGKSEAWVSLHVSLLKLHPKVQAMLDPDLPKNERLNSSMGFYLAQIEDQEHQLKLAQEMMAKDIKTTQARDFLTKRTEEIGATIKTRKREPKEDFRLLNALAARTLTGLNKFVDMEQSIFESLFKSRPFDDRKLVIERLEGVIGALKKVQNRIDEMD